jgi:hypothetical protein
MSTWKSECPIEGRCSECGYEYQWKHLLGPNLGVPKWFFETARRRLIRSAISTSVRTLMPWHFWKSVPLHAPMSRKRLSVLVIGGLVAVYLIGIAALVFHPILEAIFPRAMWSSGVWWVYGSILEGIEFFVERQLLPAAAWPFGPGMDRDLLPRPVMLSASCLFATMALTPACFLPVAYTLKTRGVKCGHVLRASAYVWVNGCILVCAWFALMAIMYSVNTMMGGPGCPAYWTLGWVAAFLWPMALLIQWSVVFKRYLRLLFPISSAFLVWFLAVLLGVIGGALLIGLVEWMN